MCGIAGIIQATPSRYNKVHLEKMTAALTHRGPDGEGSWQNDSGSALLGHRRLSIIDLTTAGQQPFHYLNRYTIIHNGEIYNYIELKEELRKKGYSFQSQTDTEVIAASYDCWQNKCVEHFDGMFAFAIWDEKEKELFAARDRFGEKPFFYTWDQQERILCFASEMKGLWAAGIARNPNLNMLFNFITIGYTDNPENPAETFDNLVKKLPPAHWMKISLNNASPCTIEKYWEIDPGIRNKLITDNDAIAQFEELFRNSIKKRLRSDVAIGTSLSGGLDSSSVAAISHEFVSPQQSQKCFTAGFEGFDKDESSYAKQVAGQFGLAQMLVNITAKDLLQDWEKLCYHQEEPFGSAGAYAQYKVFELAKQNGIKVLLDGQGADETLAGYHKYYKWYWQELFRKRKLIRSKELKAAKSLGIKESFNFKNMIAAWFPGFASVVVERQYLLKAISHEDLTKEFVRLHSKEAYYTPPEHFTLNGVLHFNTQVHGLEELLRYADRNAMAHCDSAHAPLRL